MRMRETEAAARAALPLPQLNAATVMETAKGTQAQRILRLHLAAT